MALNSIVKMIIFSALIVTLSSNTAFAKDYLGFQPGKKATYKIVKEGAGGSSESEVTALYMKPTIFDGKKLNPVMYNGMNTVFYYIGKDGVYRYARQELEDVDPIKVEEVEYWLKFPLKRGGEFTKKVKTLCLNGSFEDIDVKVTYELLKDTINVPAGTFENCLRVHTYGKTTITLSSGSIVDIEIERYEWLAPGVGTVKGIFKETSSSENIGSGSVAIILVDLQQ